jgi:ABC-type antimicrobial peptide transport system permease subunit
VIYQPFLADSNNVGSATLLAATSRSVREVEPSLRQAIAAVDARVEVLNIRAMDDQVDVMLSVERMVSRLTLIFGLLALLLAAIGIYGVFAHDVVRRSHEIGVRLALGASPAGIQAWVLTEATRLLLAGVVLGVPLAFMAARGARALFYGVTAADPVTVLGAAAVLVCTLVVAVWVPSRRAARTDPLTTIRAD